MQKLKILIVSHGVLNNDSGMGRVHYELKQEFEKAGHLVDKVDFSDLYPKGQNEFQKIFEPYFPEKLFKYLKKNAHKYDVIDANFENIIYPKEAFNFKGLLFVRSHGIRPLYEKAYELGALGKSASTDKRSKTIRNHIGSFIKKHQKSLTPQNFYDSLKYADVVHCLNKSEYEYFINYGIAKDKLVIIPNGYPASYLQKLNSIGKEKENVDNSISCISSWSFHKGIKDWREISKKLISITKVKEILFLGTYFDFDFVKVDFDEIVYPYIKLVPQYKPADLPNLLRKIKAGVFPSYMEGLPYGVLEQLASGIPVIAYKVPGVTDFVEQVDPAFLVEPGDIDQLIKKTKLVLEMDEATYKGLSLKCIEVSQKYVLEEIALLFLKTYDEAIKKING